MRKITNHSAREVGQNSLSTSAPSGDEWVRLPKPRARFWGLSRTTILEMISRGEVRSCVIKKRHAIRGIRLVYLPSLREALEKLAPKAERRTA